MIEAAIEVSGALGYETASTRLLAERAEVNLSAIPYHFGGKHALYLAAAEAIAAYAREYITLVTRRLEDPATPAADRIEAALSLFFHLAADSVQPRAWTAFLSRSIDENGEAFRIIYDTVFADFQEALVKAAASGCDPSDEALRLRVSLTITSILAVRTMGTLTMKGMGWDRLDPARTAMLDRIVRELARSDLLLGALERR